MKIAIAAYVDRFSKFIHECNLMTYSGRGLDGRFTFVIYADPMVIDQLDRWPNVELIPYEAPKEDFYEKYRFSRSMVFPYDHPEPLKGYDYICKTDTDVFLTPMMNSFPFHSNKIYVGKAAYSVNEAAVDLLRQAAIRFGYPQYQRISDMHSTIIAPTDDMLKIMKLSDDLEKVMYYGLEEPGEWLSDKALWRGHYDSISGICSMYALEIVVSSIYPKDRVVVTTKIDGPTNGAVPWTDFYHLHQYHNDTIYSKFQVRYGAYLESEYAIGKSIAEYCLNTYLTRLDHMKKRPELFVNTEIYREKLPPTFEEPIAKYYDGHPANGHQEAWEL